MKKLYVLILSVVVMGICLTVKASSSTLITWNNYSIIPGATIKSPTLSAKYTYAAASMEVNSYTSGTLKTTFKAYITSGVTNIFRATATTNLGYVCAIVPIGYVGPGNWVIENVASGTTGLYAGWSGTLSYLSRTE